MIFTAKIPVVRKLIATLQFLTMAFVYSVPAKSDEQIKQTITSKISHLKFQGICDGSAAVPLDNETILVAYDEKNALFSYNIRGGNPVARVDLSRLMEMPTGDGHDEIDIEAGVRIDKKIWWIGSHGQNKKGKDRPNRRMIFSTNIPGRNLKDTKVIDPPFDLTKVFLTNPILAKLLTRRVRSNPPKQGGISIEGLARHPKNGLIVGFRSPLTGAGGQKGNAIAVHIVEKQGSFRVNKVYILDLGNRGFRDIALYQDSFLLIAGPAGKKGNSVLFNWHLATNAIRQISEPFKDINPEALVRINQQWLMLSDDGKQKRPDENAADGDRKCDKIRKKSGENHPNVYFNALIFDF